MGQDLTPQAREALERNGIVIDITGMTEEHTFIRDMQELDIALAFAMFQTGCPDKAANLLGLSNIAGRAASRNPHVQRLIKVLIRSDLQSTGIKKAYDALVGVLDDQGESATARNRAAETILKWSGEIGKEADRDKESDLSNMTIGELESVIAKLEHRKEELSKDVITVQSD